MQRMVVRITGAVGLAVWMALVGPAAGQAQDGWKPVPGRLLSRFAADLDPGRVLPEYPRPQLKREAWLDLNGLWEFRVAGTNEAPPLGRTLEGKILVPFPVESALSGVGARADRVWYRRTFEVPGAWAGSRVKLHFGAVDWETTVWVNGRNLGSHRGGYDAFSFDITGALRAKGPQELVVGVWDPSDAGPQPRGKQVREPRGIWYTPSTGIWQTVWLEPVPPAHIERLRLDPDVDWASVHVRAECAGEVEGFSLVVEVATPEGPVTARGAPGDRLTLSLPSPRLWTPGTPHLYPVTCRLTAGERTVDKVESYFGLRTIEVKRVQGTPRICLNGRFVFQIGPLDQGFWPGGLYTAPTDAALRYDLEVMKRLGFNMVRKHVKVEPARWYHWCDRLGLLVWQDMPSGDRSPPRGRNEIERAPESARQFEAELTQLVEQHRNHPSIVAWVVFNEGWGQFDTARLAKRVKALDPTRLVVGASGWHDVADVGDVRDRHAYPGPAAPKPEARRALVLGEFGGLGLPLAGHTWQSKKNWGYRNLKSRDELNRDYLRLIEDLHLLIGRPGLSAAVYTQITDVEGEVNGLLTYDRAVLKVDPEAVARAHRRLEGPPPVIRPVAPTAEAEAVTWRYTLAAPVGTWFQPAFDDRAWREAPAGFGREDTPGAISRTSWTTPDIWLRRAFMLDRVPEGDIRLRLHHDEDAEVYLNGVLAARLRGYTTGYVNVRLSPEARAALARGRNVLAIHCRQTRGGQYIDAGLVVVEEEKG